MIADGDWADEAVRKAVQEVQAAVTVAATAAIIAATREHLTNGGAAGRRPMTGPG